MSVTFIIFVLHLHSNKPTKLHIMLLEGKTFKYAPRHKVSASVIWNNPIINATWQGFYKGEQYTNDENTEKIDSYFTCDMQFSRPVFNYLNLSLDIQDVFNNEHMETNQYISPGRLITARVTFTF
jgi:outer membrane cobalamin receptor